MPTSAYNKFNQFTQDLQQADQDFNADAYKVMLTNTAPVAANALKADITEITAGNGYTAGGAALTITTSTSAGTAKVTVSTDITWTASGGNIGPFRYAVVYNDTKTTPLKPLVCWFDYGAAVTLAPGESFVLDFDQTNGLFTVA